MTTVLFRRLDAVIESPDAILASNASSVPIMMLAMATGREGRVLGIQFFNPVPVLRRVELVPSLVTSEKTKRVVERLAVDLGKTVIWSKDRAGFVVNALLVPFLLSSACWRTGRKSRRHRRRPGPGLHSPDGPLRLCDFIGTDTVAAFAESMYAEFKKPLYSPPRCCCE